MVFRGFFWTFSGFGGILAILESIMAILELSRVFFMSKKIIVTVRILKISKNR